MFSIVRLKEEYAEKFIVASDGFSSDGELEDGWIWAIREGKKFDINVDMKELVRE
jgi:hypothetical protein